MLRAAKLTSLDLKGKEEPFAAYVLAANPAT